MIILLPFQKTTGGKSKADRENFQVIGQTLKRIVKLKLIMPILCYFLKPRVSQGKTNTSFRKE